KTTTLSGPGILQGRGRGSVLRTWRRDQRCLAAAANAACRPAPSAWRTNPSGDRPFGFGQVVAHACRSAPATGPHEKSVVNDRAVHAGQQTAVCPGPDAGDCHGRYSDAPERV